MTSDHTHFLAPAKINLFLRVLGRRLDGYHMLDSLMLPVSLFDEIDVQFESMDSRGESAIVVHCDFPNAPSGPANLAFRAAGLLLEAAGQSARVQITLRKRIPVGSGLGGGSSDAAAVLCHLNRLLATPFDTISLANLGARLGADVPFFVYGRPARIGGVGEVVHPVAFENPLSLVVCSDGSALSTRQVYANVDLSLTTGRPLSNIADFISGRTPLPEFLTNDLETTVAQMHPGLLPMKAMLIDLGALGALMTGSGSAVFGVWPNPGAATDAAGKLRGRGFWAQAVQTLQCSPVVED